MNRTATRPIRLAAITVLMGAMLSGAGACGSGTGSGNTAPSAPSAQEFCTAVTENADKLRESTQKVRDLAESSGVSQSVSQIASAAKSFVDLARLSDELAAVAPPEVKADVEKIRTAFDNLSTGAQPDATNVAAAAKETLDSLRNSGELQRLNDYAKQQCGVDLA